MEFRIGGQVAVLVSRSVFDNFLLEKAKETGIEVRCGEKVLECKEREKCVEVTTSDNSYLASFVLIAEGSQGMLKYPWGSKEPGETNWISGLFRKSLSMNT